MKTFQNVNALRLGLLVNPFAGIGGPRALKGSDGITDQLRAQACEQAAVGQTSAQQRFAQCIRALNELLVGHADTAREVHWVVVGGHMGWPVGLLRPDRMEVLPFSPPEFSTAVHTQAAICALESTDIDLLIFVGGDGTARDICDVLGKHIPVIGMPAGVKMHSGVFAINPQAAASLLARLINHQWLPLEKAEVRDIDESALASGAVRARHYGDMLTVVSPEAMQQVKCSGQTVDELVATEIAAGVVESMHPGVSYVLGPGTTTAAVMAQLGLPNSLLGCDVVRDGELLLADATATELEALAETQKLQIIVSPTGHQGSLLGRGNQQLSATVLRQVGKAGIQVLCTAEKLQALNGRPLRLDTGDAALDLAFSGLWPITVGYQQQALYHASA